MTTSRFTEEDFSNVPFADDYAASSLPKSDNNNPLVILSRPPATFTRFPNLPYELRSTIWNYAIRVPRIVSVQSIVMTKKREPTPPVLAVCQESRLEGLNHYERVPIHRTQYSDQDFSQVSSQVSRTGKELVGYSYINFELDVIHYSATKWAAFPGHTRGLPPQLCKALDYKYNEKVRRMVLSNEVVSRPTMFTDILMLFKNLDELIVLYDETATSNTIFHRSEAFAWFERQLTQQLSQWKHQRLFNDNKHKLKIKSRGDLFLDLKVHDHTS